MASQLTPQQLIKAVVAAGARLPLVAERVQMNPGEIVASITAEQGTLAEQLRTAFLLQLFDNLMQTQLVFQQHLDVMSPDTVARAYAAQAAAFASLTSRPSEDAAEQPVDIQAARSALEERLAEYQRRKEAK